MMRWRSLRYTLQEAKSNTTQEVPVLAWDLPVVYLDEPMAPSILCWVAPDACHGSL
jgi:hypothetical protein